MLQNILYATDGSSVSEHAVRYAAKLAKAHCPVTAVARK